MSRFAYADPPYLGTSSFGAAHHYSHQHDDAKAYDSLEAHRELIARLGDFDGWALSLHSPSLRLILPLCPDDVRVAAWVKPFASFKPGVNPGYCWEPVIYRGARTAKQRGGKSAPTVRDFVSANITLRKGTSGAKPEAFAFWLFELLGLTPADEFTDLFHGSGAIAEAHAKWSAQRSLSDGAA